MNRRDVRRMKPDEALGYLERLIAALDELEQDDFFGTEGWRRRLHPMMGQPAE
jgi:hypothetical protein